MIAYIPARGGSKRIPRKNIKPLGGKPILAHVIENLRGLQFIERICVSTDDAEIETVARRAGAVVGERRRATLANDKAGFSELIREDVPRFAGEVPDLLFVLPTAALVREEDYNGAWKAYSDSSAELLMSVVDYPITPYWALRKAPDGRWAPLFREMHQLNSQNLPETCVDAGLFYMMKWKQVRERAELIDSCLSVYRLPDEVAVDVDSPKDWERLEELYAKRALRPTLPARKS